MSAVATVPQDLAALDAMLAAVDTLDESSIGAAFEQATDLRKIAQTVKKVQHLREKACLLEAAVLRRAGALGEAVVKKTIAQGARPAARYLGGLDDTAFQAFVDRMQVELTTARAMHQRIKREDDAAQSYERGRRMALNFRSQRPVSPHERSVVSDAARVLLDAAMAEERLVTVPDVVEEMYEILGVQAIDSYEPALKEGFAEIVREAMRASAGDEDGRIGLPEDHPLWALPTFITYLEDELGWVRIPWYMATLDHLNFMRGTRQRQADELLAKVAALDAAIEFIEASGEGDQAPLGDVVRSAVPKKGRRRGG